jgi:hypothetical protein
MVAMVRSGKEGQVRHNKSVTEPHPEPVYSIPVIKLNLEKLQNVL